MAGNNALLPVKKSAIPNATKKTQNGRSQYFFCRQMREKSQVKKALVVRGGSVVLVFFITSIFSFMVQGRFNLISRQPMTSR